jgi:L-rhamnose mutarotase
MRTDHTGFERQWGTTMHAVHGKTNPEVPTDGVRRLASVIRLVPELEQMYRELHANVWDSVASRLRKSNIRNYSIFIAGIEGRKYLFSYCEYSGSDYEGDMRKIAEDPETRRWWQQTDPCQIPLPECVEGKRWCDLERVFFLP